MKLLCPYWKTLYNKITIFYINKILSLCVCVCVCRSRCAGTGLYGRLCIGSCHHWSSSLGQGMSWFAGIFTISCGRVGFGTFGYGQARSGTSGGPSIHRSHVPGLVSRVPLKHRPGVIGAEVSQGHKTLILSPCRRPTMRDTHSSAIDVMTPGQKSNGHQGRTRLGAPDVKLHASPLIRHYANIQLYF